jgi:hypothetical protein
MTRETLPPTPSAAGEPNQRPSRAFISFRRKADFAWFALTLVLFGFSCAVLVYTAWLQEPQIVERTKVVPPGRRVAAPPARKSETAAPAPTPPAKPAPAVARTEAPPAPPAKEESRVQAGTPEVRHKISHFFLDKFTEGKADILPMQGENVLVIDVDFSGGGRWVDTGQDVDPDFHKVTRYDFELKGEGGSFTLEFKVEATTGENFGIVWNNATGGTDWKRFSFSREQLRYMWGGGGENIDWKDIKMIHFAISTYPDKGDTGDRGRVLIRRIRFS